MNVLAETYKHILTVQRFMSICIKHLITKSLAHDQSKLHTPEAETFEEYTPKLAGVTYGSEKYKGYLAQMKPALEHHYASNKHHPEHSKLWKCVMCKNICRDSEKIYPPNDENKVFFCPVCCKNGIIYECSLEKHIGLEGMNLLDLIEMLCDWKAATLRHNDGDMLKSLEINAKRFGYSDELKQIFKNTIIDLDF